MPVDLVPHPLSVTELPGTFLLSDDVVIVARGSATDPAWLLHDALRAGTGLNIPVTAKHRNDSSPSITFTQTGEEPPDAFPSTAIERYRLDIRTDGVTIESSHPAGFVRAVQTLRQLLPPSTLRTAPVAPGPVEVPCVSIDDEPRFGWRGVMLDVARHFQPKEFVLRLIDLAALHQLNVIHLHLTDDQGWRLEVPGWPKLTEIGSWRSETVRGHGRAANGFDGTPHGGYYSTDDLREIVAYAARRHITVVPEIDMPGHVRAVLAAHPELGNTGQQKPVATTFGIFSEVLAPTDEALAFARDVLDTVVDIFDSPFIHIGGDECPRTEWEESDAARARARELGLSDVSELQSWFTAQLADHARLHGRRVIGWDEILEDGGAPRDAVVSVWREFATAAKAVAAGHDVIVAPQRAVYLDWYPSADPDEPLHIHGHTPLETVADFDPAPADVSEAAPQGDGDHAPAGDPGTGFGRIFGVQAQLWTEYMPTPRSVEYAAFPRLSAVADMAWASMDNRQHHPVTTRMPAHLQRLDAVGVNYRPLDGPRPWQRGGTGDRARFDTR
ncbi:beta-N-acetylhexosaminidase [Actinobacteria bacterium YIM 96077]|uniref:beta-N-acetylhexosaminidase n=1 Tax=Phytoactinopolyspora halophila TaxID=1981511 RepID=A0A329QLA0_9ACTN|nr:beta-N-acetylhexosaminidase [Phytoactinopolyspora halophila]AYY14826.1 beta-N-acetylhexosaminidase [Actinobacteria bacterium YIM 96077]RAW13100.1 beta-N-acetylhexosaminidase [Phytoactinopolyspora halophila]